MPRMRILSATEQQLFDLPPKFDSVQRQQFFDFPIAQRTVADDFRNPSSRIGFFIAGGYFKATKCFFAPSDFHQRDVEYIARQLALPEESFVPQNYTKTTRLRHEHLILEFYGFKRFDTAAEKFISEEITNMARAQLKPKLIFWRCVDLLVRNKGSCGRTPKSVRSELSLLSFSEGVCIGCWDYFLLVRSICRTASSNANELPASDA